LTGKPKGKKDSGGRAGKKHSVKLRNKRKKESRGKTEGFTKKEPDHGRRCGRESRQKGDSMLREKKGNVKMKREGVQKSTLEEKDLCAGFRKLARAAGRGEIER